ncbi:hypothetical protein [Kluyvera ascorbata]
MPVPLAQKEETVFTSKRFFMRLRFACLLPTFRQQTLAEDRESLF